MARTDSDAPSWLEGAVALVAEQLATRPEDSQRDIHVWDDDSVTGPKDSDSAVAERRLIATFSPGEHPNREAIETTLINGLQTVPSRESDQERRGPQRS